MKSERYNDAIESTKRTREMKHKPCILQEQVHTCSIFVACSRTVASLPAGFLDTTSFLLKEGRRRGEQTLFFGAHGP